MFTWQKWCSMIQQTPGRHIVWGLSLRSFKLNQGKTNRPDQPDCFVWEMFDNKFRKWWKSSKVSVKFFQKNQSDWLFYIRLCWNSIYNQLYSKPWFKLTRDVYQVLVVQLIMIYNSVLNSIDWRIVKQSLLS